MSFALKIFNPKQQEINFRFAGREFKCPSRKNVFYFPETMGKLTDNDIKLIVASGVRITRLSKEQYDVELKNNQLKAAGKQPPLPVGAVSRPVQQSSTELRKQAGDVVPNNTASVGSTPKIPVVEQPAQNVDDDSSFDSKFPQGRETSASTQESDSNPELGSSDIQPEKSSGLKAKRKTL